MTQTLRPGRPKGATLNGAAPASRSSRKERRGRLVVAAAGLVVLALAVVVFEILVPKAPGSRPVLVATRSIRAGEVISAGDVRVATVASAQFSGVAASSRDQVVGRTVGLDVGAGQPLVDADLGAAPGPGPGEGVLGLSLPDGRFPDGLSAGDTVVVVDTPGPSGGSSTPQTPGVELARGRLLSATRSSDGSRTDVALVVPTGSSDAVASASASDSVSLVWIARPAP